MALGAKSGSIWLADNVDYPREANFGGVPLAAIARQPDDERPRYRLPLVRLDDFYDQPRLDFLKIDVEGMEADVLRGAERLIRTHRPIIHVENDRAEKSRDLVELLRSQGYRLRLHKPPLYSPTNYAGSRTDLFPGDRVAQPAVHPRIARQERGIPALMPMSESSGSPPGTDAQRAFEDALRLHTGGDLAGAVNAYRAILSRHPRAAPCWSNLGAALRGLGRKHEGPQVLREGARRTDGFKNG